MKLRTLMSVAAVLQAVGTFASPSWTFTPAGASVSDGSAGTIASSDGVWELKVLIVKASDKTLAIGSKTDSQQAGGGHAFVRGSGDLDLRGAVTRANTSETWKIVNLNWGSLGRGATSGFVSPGSLYAPTTLKAMNRCFACTDSCYQSFTNVVVEDGITEIGARFFKECLNLNTVKFGKDVAKVGEKTFLYCMSLESVEIDNPDFDLSSLDGAINYHTAIKPDGSLYPIPNVTVAGCQQTLEGKAALTDANWADLGAVVPGTPMEDYTGYHFFRIVLKKIGE